MSIYANEAMYIIAIFSHLCDIVPTFLKQRLLGERRHEAPAFLHQFHQNVIELNKNSKQNVYIDFLSRPFDIQSWH